MEKIWAPWRIKYILQVDKSDTCIFCEKPSENKDAENCIVYRGTTCFSILNVFPYNAGHVMVAPYRHTATLDDLSDEELLDLMSVARRCQQVLHDCMHPEGFNWGINIGRAAGAGITDHIHLHIVPRWSGDTNFMPVVGETKVISQSLHELYELMVKTFPNIPS